MVMDAVDMATEGSNCSGIVKLGGRHDPFDVLWPSADLLGDPVGGIRFDVDFPRFR